MWHDLIGWFSRGTPNVNFSSCLPELVFTPPFLKIVVWVKASGPLHVFELWLGVSKGMHYYFFILRLSQR